MFPIYKLASAKHTNHRTILSFIVGPRRCARLNYQTWPARKPKITPPSTPVKMLNKDEIENLKVIFAEGFAAGVNNSSTNTKWKGMVFSLLIGVVIGFCLPLVAFTVSLNKERKEKDNMRVDAKSENITFTDVKGADEAKKELQELVEFLKRPQKFTSLGGKLPKGVLLVGPPGNGKTLLARALAGEAGVPFIQMSGSEFEEMFVGEGARRVRELFKVAKRVAPCVIFIDEVDSVGSRRTASPLHPHSNQTINQLLSEMDGFRKNEGIIVVAATNRRDDLDYALLRPGRFDVEIVVSPPTYSERKDIIEYYLDKVVREDIDTDLLAKGTVGFTGADIENMVNRAALKAATAGDEYVSLKHLMEERDRKLMGGAENKNQLTDNHVKSITAYHEGGHCIVAYFTPNSQALHKVTILPRGQTLGHTAFLPEKDEICVSKAQLLARLDSLLAGRAAEELIFGSEQVTTGAADDLEVANELALRMVTRLGMSEKMGLRTGRKDKMCAAAGELIEVEVQRILNESYERAKVLLKKYSKEHSELAAALMLHETLDAKAIREIIDSK